MFVKIPPFGKFGDYRFISRGFAEASDMQSDLLLSGENLRILSQNMD